MVAKRSASWVILWVSNSVAESVEATVYLKDVVMVILSVLSRVAWLAAQ
jgi:hypothetical protein